MAAQSPETALQQLRSQHGPQTYDNICGVQRALWAYVDLLPEPKRSEAEALLTAAYVMGSKMHARLVERALADGPLSSLEGPDFQVESPRAVSASEKRPNSPVQFIHKD